MKPVTGKPICEYCKDEVTLGINAVFIMSKIFCSRHCYSSWEDARWRRMNLMSQEIKSMKERDE